MIDRIRCAWALVRRSYGVIESDRSLLAFPLLALAAAALAIGFSGFEAWFVRDAWNAPAGVVAAVLVVGVYALTFVGVFFSVALAAAASRSLDGVDTTIGEGVSCASERLGAIARWALVATTVLLVLKAVEASFGTVGRIAGRVAEAGWAAATFFVVPVLALEPGSGVGDAIDRSTGVFRRNWAEEVAGGGTIWAGLTLLALVPAGLLGWLGLDILRTSTALGGFYIGVAVLIEVAAVVAAATLRGVFAVALYREARNDLPAAA